MPKSRKPSRSATTSGFTLIELMVVVAMVVVLARLAAPAFTELISSANVSRAVNDFIMDTRYARGEAMRRGRNVTICRTATPSAYAPVCSNTGNSDWSQGWIVFVDMGASPGIFDYQTDKILRVHEGLSGVGSFYAVNTNSAPIGGQDYITFDPSGKAVASLGRWLVSANGTLATNTKLTRTLCMNFVGRVRFAPPAATGASGDVLCS